MLPEEIVHKNFIKKQPKETQALTVVRSPEWIALKSERTSKMQEVEKVREKRKKEKMPELVNNLEKEIPAYFRKKK